MKILQLIPRLASGGAERFVVDLANQLVKSQDIHLYTLKGQSKENIYVPLVDDKVQLGYLNMKRWTDVSIIWRIYKLIKTERYDVVHAHGRAFHYVCFLTFIFKHLKVTYTVHSNASRSVNRGWEIKLFRYFFTSGRITPVLISKEQEDNFKELYPKTYYIRIDNGRSWPKKTLDFSKVKKTIRDLKINEDTKVFLNIARLSPQKNHYMLIDSFKRCIEKGMDCILIIIGRAVEGHEESEKISSYVKNNCSDRIIWLGEKGNATDFLYAADFFCLSSHWEGMPITVLEAMATGTITVSTPAGEIPLMLKNREEGFIANDFSGKEFVKTLQRAYSTSEQEADDIGKKLVEKFNKKYTIESCANNYIDLYIQLLSKKTK